MKIRRKPIVFTEVLEAKELTEYFQITTIVGKELGKPGDFLISDGEHADWILKKADFEEFYDVVAS